MNKKIKKQWLEALRSGKYRQTKEALKDDDGYCCLGVLCNLVKDRVGEDFDGHKDYEGDSEKVGYLFMGKLFYPPEKILKLARISIKGAKKLANLNDDGNTFEQIANHIDRYY